MLTFNHESIRSQGAMADRVTSRSLTTLLNYVIQASGERRDHGRRGYIVSLPVISRPGIDITSYWEIHGHDGGGRVEVSVRVLDRAKVVNRPGGWRWEDLSLPFFISWGRKALNREVFETSIEPLLSMVVGHADYISHLLLLIVISPLFTDHFLHTYYKYVCVLSMAKISCVYGWPTLYRECIEWPPC